MEKKGHQCECSTVVNIVAAVAVGEMLRVLRLLPAKIVQGKSSSQVAKSRASNGKTQLNETGRQLRLHFLTHYQRPRTSAFAV